VSKSKPNINNDVDKTTEDRAEGYKTLDFGCEYTENIPALLKKLNIALAFTSYQAGRLMLVRSDGESLDVNFKSFKRPMGLVANEDGLTLGVFTQIINFHREDGLLDKIKQPLQDIKDDVTAPRIKPKKLNVGESEDLLEELKENLTQEPVNELSPEQIEEQKKLDAELLAHQKNLTAPADERVDACYITRSAHYSGMINIHDIDWGDEGLWVVNSSFSCLCTVEPDYSFVPRWKPYFISELLPEDRCHLNGMALRDGKPAYVTTFSQYDEVGMWRKGDKFNGTLMDVESNSILVDGLTMPHSPRWHQNKVYFCNSGYGLICTYDPLTKKHVTLAEAPGFTRGIDFYGSLMFVGLSKVRVGDVKTPPPLAEKYDETYSGIWLYNLENNSEIGHIKFTGNVDQIYDVAVIPNCSFPELIEPSHPRMRNHFSHPKL